MGTLAGNYYGGIVKDGLVLMLDAAKKDSYDRLGTTWRDISWNGNNGTLTNFSSPSPQTIWNSNNGGSIVFDGTNDYIVGPVSNNLNFCNSTNDLPFSTSVWCYVNSLSNPFILYNKGDNGNGESESYATSINSSGKITFTLYDTVGSNQTTITTVSSVSTGQWLNIITTYFGTGGNTNMKIYVNSILQSTTASSVGTYTRMRVQNTNLFLGSFGSTGTFRLIQSNGRYSSFLFYSKELSASEVLQNYNATKGRYL